MKSWMSSRRWMASIAALGTLMQFGGCGLSDQQWAGISQTVIQTGILTVLSNVIQALFAGVNGTTA